MKTTFAKPANPPIKSILISQPGGINRYESRKTLIIEPRTYGPIEAPLGVTLTGHGPDRSSRFDIALDLERTTELVEALNLLIKQQGPA